MPDADVLNASPLFDVDWYADTAGCERSKEAAVSHYLAEGRASGLPPHPLFDPQYFARGRAKAIRGRDPFAFYLSRQLFKAPTHPLFDTAAYLATTPAAGRHPLGPIGHYVTVGAAKGLRPNDWYVPHRQREPRGLVDWLVSRRDEWLSRQSAATSCWSSEAPDGTAADLPIHQADRLPADRHEAGTPAISIVLAADGPPESWMRTVESVLAQSLPDWELLLLHDYEESALDDLLGTIRNDHRLRLLPRRDWARSKAWNFALAVATGTHVAFLRGGDVLAEDHLRMASAVLATDESLATYAVAESASSSDEVIYSSLEATADRLAAGATLDLSVLVVRRSAAIEIGAFDEGLPNAFDHDFVLRLARRGSLRFLPFVGVRIDEQQREAAEFVPRRERPSLDHSKVETWHDVALNRYLVDWKSLESRNQRSDTVTIVIPTHRDWRMTLGAIHSLTKTAGTNSVTLEILVVNNGCGVKAAAVLESLPHRFPNVRVIHSPANLGFALGNNLAMPHATGETVVFLNNDTAVSDGWLDPLMEALADPEILAAQSLLIYPSGSIQSAGIAFPSSGGVPHALLQRFPVEDARGLENARFSALTAAALAMRFADVVALRGFDPIYRNGMEDVDLGLRLRDLREGYLTVRPDSVVRHFESKSSGRFLKSSINRRIFLDRWAGRMPVDDMELWRGQGFDVVGYSIRNDVDRDRRLCVPEPVLTRRPVVSVAEAAPSLRWAIKNPAPADASAEQWGDTHFARRLAVALRGLGQDVVIDHRPEFVRPTGHLDDVVLLLRGLADYRPAFGQVNLVWLISHPEMFSRVEAESYDRVLAASVTWAERMTRQWNVRIDPLLQATDASLFNPDRARPDTGHPVLFVGGSRRQLRPMVRDAVESGLALSVYGSGWEGLIPRRYVKAQYFPNELVGQAYRSAGVVLNDHWDDMRVEGFLSNRLFDAAASGARVITDEVAGLGDIFGRSVQVARDAKELVQLATAPDLDAIFGDDEERRKVAQRMHTEHSFEARARQLLDVALDERARMASSRLPSP